MTSDMRGAPGNREGWRERKRERKLFCFSKALSLLRGPSGFLFGSPYCVLARTVMEVAGWLLWVTCSPLHGPRSVGGTAGWFPSHPILLPEVSHPCLWFQYGHTSASSTAPCTVRELLANVACPPCPRPTKSGSQRWAWLSEFVAHSCAVRVGNC